MSRTTAETPRRSRRRTIAAVSAVAATLTAALVAAALTSGAGGLNIAVERFVGASQGALGDVGGLLPLGLAFAAGMASAVNPCGFPLLPAYLGWFLADESGSTGRAAARLRRALAVSTTMTVTFVLLFAAIGLPIWLGARAIVGWLPWLALGLGVVLVAAGGYQLAGSTLYSTLPERLGARLPIGRRGVRTYAPFGLAYGLASLSCTLPIFLPVVGLSSTTTSGPGSLVSLGLYGLGMGTVITGLTVAAALFRTALASQLRRLLPHIATIGTAALFIAGGYLVYYWLTIGGLLRGS